MFLAFVQFLLIFELVQGQFYFQKGIGQACTYSWECSIDLTCKSSFGTQTCQPVGVCPNGRPPNQMCGADNNYFCPQPMQCDTSGRCCLGGGPVLPNCPDGTKAIQACPCPNGYQCSNGGCCPQNQDLCRGGEVHIDPMTGGTKSCSPYNSNSCPTNALCNPLTNVCCNILPEICKGGKLPYVDNNNRPVACVQGCADQFTCDQSTGFCCGQAGAHKQACLPDGSCNFPFSCLKGRCDCPETQELDTANNRCKQLPRLGESCELNPKCGVPYSICTIQKICECIASIGYTRQGDTCKRSKIRLDETCKSDAECTAAYSFCNQSKCKCRAGFEKNGENGCQATSFKCTDGSEPLKFNSQIVTCHISCDLTKTTVQECPSLFLDDSCALNNYCVPYFEDPQVPGRQRGFCCNKPPEIAPVCPVGQPHASSVNDPTCGCCACPSSTHFCHRDPKVTTNGACCPKACINPEDVYANFQCFQQANYGDPCQVNEQCIGNVKDPAAAKQRGELMKCVQLTSSVRICDCETGFVVQHGKCIRALCSGGQEGLKYSSGRMVRCSNNAVLPPDRVPCTTGFHCDMTFEICCRDLPNPYL